LPPGAVEVGKSRVLIGTATDPYELEAVQPPGKKEMRAIDWARGTRIADGERVG
jgi:methionyl-tRNA formyltransferase